MPTGPGEGSGSGVYYIDFSDDFKKCLKLAREKLEKTEHVSEAEKMEDDWIGSLAEVRSRPLDEKFYNLKVCFIKKEQSAFWPRKLNWSLGGKQSNFPLPNHP